MLMLQLSAGQGPTECSLAVHHALKLMLKEADTMSVKATILETQDGAVTNSFKSVLVSLEGELATKLATQWQGTIQWICKSSLRPQHGRKNWFIGCTVFEHKQRMVENEVRFQACRASGAGGQHVNKTNSAVQATHLATGISVKIQTERSQHANKRLAKLLLDHKLSLLEKTIEDQNIQQKWLAHWQLERGNPKRTFKGNKFKEI